MIELVYETHSTTLDNETGHATGWLPGELSEAGREQAIQLGARRRDVDAVFSSDLGRALETVAIALFDADVPIFHDWRLRECDYGALNGAPADELEAAKHIEVPFPGGESYRDVVARVASFLADLRHGWDGSACSSSPTRRRGGRFNTCSTGGRSRSSSARRSTGSLAGDSPSSVLPEIART